MANGLVPKSFIQDLLHRLDIVTIIGRYITLKQRGHAHLACCPFHQEKTPSFNVSHKKQFYHCFGCGVSGDAIAFVMAYERLTFIEAVIKLAEQAGLNVPLEHRQAADPQRTDKLSLLNQVVAFYQQALQRDSIAFNYLKNRGLDKTIELFKLGYVPPGWDNLSTHMPLQHADLAVTGMLITRKGGGYYDRFRHRIMFPIVNRHGDCIAFGGRVMDDGEPKYLNSPETSLFQKSRELYGLYQVLQSQRDLPDITIVEGYMDVLALFEHNQSRVVATLGTATTIEHLEILFRYTQTIFFCFDGDKAGRAAAWRALVHCCQVLQDGRRAKFIFLPEGDDPDTFIRREGSIGWARVLSEALHFEQFLFGYLRAEIPLNTVAGRAQFAQRAMPLLKTIPSLSLQSLLIDELSKMTRLDLTTLGIEKATEPMAMRLASSTYRGSLTRSQLACAFLLQYPELISHIHHTQWLSELIEPGASVLLLLIECLQEYSFENTAQILAYFQGEPAIESLSHWANYPLLCPDQGVVEEFNDLLKSLRQATLDLEITQLMKQAAAGGLNLSEKRVLQDLLRKRKTSKNMSLDN